MFGPPGRLGTEREAAFEKRREPQKSEAKILHVIFLQGICRLQSCNVPGKRSRTPAEGSSWVAGACRDLPGPQCSRERVEGPQQTAGVFNQDFKKGRALGVRGGWERPTRTKPQIRSRPDHCSPPVLCQPEGSIQGLYDVAFTVSVV